MLNPLETEYNFAVVIPERLWSFPKVIVDKPALVADTLVTVNPIPSFFVSKSDDSLVILFFKSFVDTWPTGFLSANDVDGRGLSSLLSLSSWGYKSTTFWLNLRSVNSSGTE